MLSKKEKILRETQSSNGFGKHVSLSENTLSDTNDVGAVAERLRKAARHTHGKNGCFLGEMFREDLVLQGVHFRPHFQ